MKHYSCIVDQCNSNEEIKLNTEMDRNNENMLIQADGLTLHGCLSLCVGITDFVCRSINFEDHKHPFLMFHTDNQCRIFAYNRYMENVHRYSENAIDWSKGYKSTHCTVGNLL